MKYGNNKRLRLTVKDVLSDDSKSYFGLTNTDMVQYQKRKGPSRMNF